MFWLITSLLALTAATVAAVSTYTYFRYRGDRFVKCPDNGKYVAVRVDSRDAALTAGLGNPQLHLSECSRWPEKRDCGQECLKQIEYAPTDCLVQNVVSRWYEGRRCAICGLVFRHIHWHDHAPALLDDENRTIEWHSIPIAQLPEYLNTHRPVCWDCHIAQTFQREYPELVTSRKN